MLFEFVLLLGTKGTEHWKRLMKLLMNTFRFEASLAGYHKNRYIFDEESSTIRAVATLLRWSVNVPQSVSMGYGVDDIALTMVRMAVAVVI